MASEPAAKSGNAEAPWPPVLVWAARLAIAAVALLGLWSFVDEVPSLIREGTLIQNFYTFQMFVMQFIVSPLCSAAALLLAAMGKRLRLAAILAAVYPAWVALGVVIFAIGVMIYGF